MKNKVKTLGTEVNDLHEKKDENRQLNGRTGSVKKNKLKVDETSKLLIYE